MWSAHRGRASDDQPQGGDDYINQFVRRLRIYPHALRDRNAELVRLYGGMNSSMSDICGSYSVAELATLADFLRRTVDAGQGATDKLSED